MCDMWGADLRLGRAILEACKSCAEQGNVREKMREEKEGTFFQNIYKMMKHEVCVRECVYDCVCMCICVCVCVCAEYLQDDET